MATVQGSCDARFNEVKDLFQSYLDSGEELGASIHVAIDGKDVLDLWGGHADEARTRAWEQDTIATVFSTSKNYTMLAGLMLVDRGIVSLDDKVAKHWPEFAANGKQDVLVRHLLSHSSGLSGWEASVTIDDVLDVPKSTALLARQAPWWTPGTASGYHSLTLGHLVGELVRRTTGKTLKAFVADEIAGPLDADFQLGAKEADWPRVAEMVSPPIPELASGSLPGELAMKTFGNPLMDVAYTRLEGWKRGENGATNGHSNARGVARGLSPIVLGGEVDGVRLLKPETVELIFQEQVNGVDLVLGVPVRFGVGFGLRADNAVSGWLPAGKIAYWGGWGGSVSILDVGRRMTVTYVMNKMQHSIFGNDRSKAYVQAVYRALGVEVPSL